MCRCYAALMRRACTTTRKSQACYGTWRVGFPPSNTICPPNVPTKHIPPVTNARMHHATPVAPPRLALLLAPTQILPLQNMTGCLPLAHICIFKYAPTCPCLPLAHVHDSSSYYKTLLPNSIKAQTSPPPRFQLRKLATKARMKRFCIKSCRCIKGL